MAELIDDAGADATARIMKIGLGEEDTRDNTMKITDAILATGHATRVTMMDAHDETRETLDVIKKQTAPTDKTKMGRAKTGGFMGLLLGAGAILRHLAEQVATRSP